MILKKKEFFRSFLNQCYIFSGMHWTKSLSSRGFAILNIKNAFLFVWFWFGFFGGFHLFLGFFVSFVCLVGWFGLVWFGVLYLFVGGWFGFSLNRKPNKWVNKVCFLQLFCKYMDCKVWKSQIVLYRSFSSPFTLSFQPLYSLVRGNRRIINLEK